MNVDEETVQLAYKLFLNRTPSQDEVRGMIEKRNSLTDLVSTFLYSPEFKRRNPKEAPQVPNDGGLGERTLIHLHIPKTAGTSLTSILALSFPDGTRKAVNNQDLLKPGETLKEEFRDTLFMHGHLPHGVARHIERKHLYVCTLRRPGHRILSYYNYIRHTEQHPTHKVIMALGMSFGDFLEWASDPQNGFRREIDNGQVRQLAGYTASNDAKLETDLLPLAVSNLLSPDMAYGLTEHFDNFIDRLCAQKILTRRGKSRKNASPNRIDFEGAVKELSAKQKIIYDNFTRWDNILYDVGEKYYFLSNT